MADDISPEQIALQGERLRVLQQTIAGLPRKRRRVFVLNRVHGLSYAEIAGRENMTESAVSRHVFRALYDCQLALAKVFGAEAPDKDGSNRWKP